MDRTATIDRLLDATLGYKLGRGVTETKLFLSGHHWDLKPSGESRTWYDGDLLKWQCWPLTDGLSNLVGRDGDWLKKSADSGSSLPGWDDLHELGWVHAR